jgi:PleD family two-component response regulator
VARHGLALAKRRGFPLLAVFAGIEELSVITADHGSRACDQSLRIIATILKDTFRDTDIVARIAQNEFAVFTVDSKEWGIDPIKKRLTEKFRSIRNDNHLQWDVPVKFDVICREAEQIVSIDDMIDIVRRQLNNVEIMKKTDTVSDNRTLLNEA